MNNLETPFLSWQINPLENGTVLLLENTESTHFFMREEAFRLKDYSVVIADSQTAGRGRHERKWISPPSKNLYFNILLPLKTLPLKYAPSFMQVAAITISEIFQEMGADSIHVKWPNDIWSNKEKLGGMVSEILSVQGNYKMSLGIGLNINTTIEDLSVIDRPTTSLSILLKRKIHRDVLLNKILAALKNAFTVFLEKQLTPWIEAWKEMDAFIGKPSRITEGNKSISGKVLDIASDGSLIFEKSDGEIISVYSGDLEI